MQQATLGIIGALEEEVQGILAHMTEATVSTAAGMAFHFGKLFSRPAVVVRCGMGKVNAALCASLMVERYHPALILNTGVAGALTKERKVLDVAIAKETLQHDYDLTDLGYEKGYVDLVNRVFVPCDEAAVSALLAAAKVLSYPAAAVRFATGDQFVSSTDVKAQIVSRFHVAACDMESGAIHQVCALTGTRFAALRTISDATDEEQEAMEFRQFLQEAAARSVGVVLNAVKTGSL